MVAPTNDLDGKDSRLEKVSFAPAVVAEPLPLAPEVAPVSQDIVFIDARVPHIQALLDGLRPGEQAFVIDGTSDGLHQIATILEQSGLTGLSGIQIVAHGSIGQLELGSIMLDSTDLAAHAGDLSVIGAHVAHGGDLALYSCDVALGASGHQFVSDLSHYAGVDVSASSHSIGSTDLGANWSLDYNTGTAMAVNPFTDSTITDFDGLLTSNPTLTGFNTNVTFNENTVNATPQLFMGDVTFNFSGDFTFTALAITGLLAEDRLTVRNQGTGAGQIGVSGTNITYGGVTFATISGGDGSGSEVDFIFNGNANSTNVEHLIENLLYADISDSPTPDRTLVFSAQYFNGISTNTLNFTGPNFTEQTGANNPFSGATFGDHSAPSFYDYDGDGDLDMFTGSQDGTIKYYRNDGGTFVQQTGASNPFNGIDVGDNSLPVVTKFNGVVSLTAGNAAGQVSYWYIDPSSHNLVQPSVSPVSSVGDIGDNAAPQYVDIDANGYMDLFVGAGDGTIHYYQGPGFGERPGVQDPFFIPQPVGYSMVDVGSNANVAFGDADGDHDLDAVVGAADGTVHYFENTFAPYYPVYFERFGSDNPFNGINVGSNSHVAMADIDGDGDADLIVADDSGNLRYFMNNLPSTSVHIHVNAQSEGPSLTGFGPGPVFSEGVSSATLVSGLTFAALNNNFNGGQMIVSGLDALDRINIHNVGTGAGQIGLSGSNVTYQGVTIGTWSGGVGQNLVVHFNGSATVAAIQALANDLQFTSVGDSPTEFRTISFYVSDATGQVANGPFIGSVSDITGTDNPFYGLFAGLRADPAMIDYDGDGRLDVLVGRGDGTFTTFHNDGGSFSELAAGTGPFGNISVSGDAHPSFGDVDHDGDLDLVVGDTDGTVHYYKNVSGIYVGQTGANNPFGSINVYTASSPSAPQLVDIDGDGDLDLAIGGTAGSPVLAGTGALHLFQNNAGTFTELTGASNPLANVYATNLTVAFGDVDGDGDLDMLVGGYSQYLQYYINTGTRTAPIYEHAAGDNNPFGLFVGTYTTLTFADYDHDGDLDVIAGDETGSLTYIQNNMPLPGVQVQVTPVNDAPVVGSSSVSFGAMYEDNSPNSQPISTVVASAFQDPDGPNSSTGTLGGIAIVSNAESGQGHWQYFDSSLGWVDIGTSVSADSALVLLASTMIQFVPAANFSGTEPALVAHLIDSSYAGQTGDIMDLTSGTGGQSPYSTGTFTLAGTVTPLNDAPVAVQSSVSLTAIFENTANPAGQTIASFAAAAFSDSADGAFGATANNFLGIVVSANPETASQGHWQYSDDGTNWTNLGHVSRFEAMALHADTQLRFLPASGFHGSAPALTAFLIDDSSGDFFSTGENDFEVGFPGDNGGSTPISATSFTIGQSITAVNDPPSGSDNAITFLEDSSYTFNAVDFGFTDPSDSPANAFLAVEVTTLPAAGTLTDNGTAVAAGQFVSVDDINNGKLVFSPAADANGTGYTTFSFQVQDDGGIAGGGVDTDQSPNTITLNVTAVNDAPTGVDNTVTAQEDTGYVFTATDFGFSDPNDSPANALQAVEITSLPTAGTLTDDGLAVTAGQFISVDHINNGKLVFTSDLDGNGSGYASFTFQVQDDGGTTNGGADTDPTAHTITIDVTAVNDAAVVTTSAANTDYVDGNRAALPPVIVDAGITVTDVDSATLASATVQITDGYDPAHDVLAFVNDGVTMGNIFESGYDSSTGTLTLSSTGSTATLAEWQAALASVTFADNAPYASAGDRTVSFTVNDGTDDSAVSTKTVHFTAARNDGFTINENDTATGTLFGPNGHGVDTDPASPFHVTAVDGDGAAVDHRLTLASGALLTVNNDGTFTYDTNHAFDGLGDAASGARNIVAFDHFDYTLTNGSTAHARITINGVDSDDHLLGTTGIDVIDAGSGDDFVSGRAGDDTLTGGTGSDLLRGDGGKDQLKGGDGDDSLFGQASADTLTGGLGRDQLFGGTGADKFVYTALSDSTTSTAGRDVIHDFVHGTDKIDLTAFHLTFDSVNDHLTGQPGQLVVYQRPFAGHYVVFADTNGDGVADFSLSVISNAALTHTDFVL